MTTPRDPRTLDAFVTSAATLNARRAKGAAALLSGTGTLDDWLGQSPLSVFHAAARDSVQHALQVLLADPSAPWPPVLEALARPELERRAPPPDAPAALPALTLTIDYVVAQCVVRGLLGRPLSDLHRDLAMNAVHSLWAHCDPLRPELREPWQAKEALLRVAFGDHASVTQRSETDLPADDNAPRTLLHLSGLLARRGLGTDDAETAFEAKSLATLTAFHYYQWVVNEDLSARIDLPTVVLATQLYQRLFEPECADARSLLARLEPARVVERMVGLLDQ